MGSRQRRAERVAAVTALLQQNPGHRFTLAELSDLLDAPRSSLGEDLAIIREAVRVHALGDVVTQPGGSGGVRFVPSVDRAVAVEIISALCRELSDPRRLVAGGYIYMTDIIFSPVWAERLGRIFSLVFTSRSTPASRPGPPAGGGASSSGADFVVTVETKGIPLALMTARCLGVPLVVARKDLRATEGSAVSISYVSGSTGRIQAMSLARRALPQGASVLIVDDFMKAGGTARGLVELMGEFGAKVVATGILTATAVPEQKLIDDYLPLTVLQGVDERRRVVSVVPGPALSGVRA